MMSDRSEWAPRKTMQQERYGSMAEDVRVRQHRRLLDIATALIQAVGWMQASDLTPCEAAMLQAARGLLECQEQELRRTG
jgi:hypothetical protein